MKSRIIWAAVVMAALVGFYFMTIRPALQPTPRKIRWPKMKDLQVPEIAPPPLPAPDITMPTLRPPPLPSAQLPPAVAARRDDRTPLSPEVPIQNAATIDFSTGAPVIRAQGGDQDALDRALREMAEATKDTTFEPAPAKE